MTSDLKGGFAERCGAGERTAVFLRPGLFAALALIAGHLFAAGAGITSWRPGAALALLAAAGLCIGCPRQTRFAVLWCLLFAGLGAAQEGILQSDAVRSDRLLDQLAGGGVEYASVTGELSDFPRRSPVSWTLMFREESVVGIKGEAANVPSLVAARIISSPETDALLYTLVPGDWLRVSGPLEQVPRQQWGGERNEWLSTRGAAALVRGRQMEVFSGQDERNAWGRFLALSRRASNRLEDRVWSVLAPHEAAILSAMMIGRTDRLTPEQRRAFRRSGVAHVFAVSGLHTMLVGGLVIFLLRLFGFGVRTRLVLLALALLFFASLVGLRSSVMRAALLLVVFEGRELLRRPIEPMAALGSIASFLMIMQPRVLWQIDFQMSFLCAAAIVLMSPWMFDLQRFMGRRLGWKWPSRVLIRTVQILCVSAGIQLILAPVMVGSFGQIPIASPIANVVMLPLVSLCLYTAFPAILLSEGLPWLGMFLLKSLSIPLAVMDEFAWLIAEIPFASISSTPWPPLVVAVLYILILSAPWSIIRRETQPRRVPWQFAPGAIALAALFVWLPVIRWDQNGLDIWFLDVGQGDAILIRSPEGRTMLVDCGPRRAGWQLPRMLNERGIDRVDVLVASHADADHIGGMDDLLANVPTGVLLVGGSLSDSAEFRELDEIVWRMSLDVSTVRRGAVVDLDRETRIEVLHPTDKFVADGDQRNDASIVLRVEYAGRAVLLAGDAEENAEVDMIKAAVDLGADVLKAGHHGSAGSSSPLFLNAVGPRHAIISCGAVNRYLHPAPEMMERLAARDISAWRTDQLGTIHLHIAPGGELTWKTARMDDRKMVP